MITINCDMGESFGIYRLGDDESLMKYVTHVNVACGFHASDPTVMWQTVRNAKKTGVKVGAHPGLADREGFGRREIRMTREEIAAAVLYQTGALQGFLAAERMPLTHIKPHGALMGMAQKQEEVANGIADAMEVLQVPIIAIGNCVLADVLMQRGVPFIREFYADLDYDDHGAQIITRHHEAITPERAKAKVLRAIREGKTRSTSGIDVSVFAESICVHSDTPGAVDVAKAVFEAARPYLQEELLQT
jgi:5-oxoprolinase (ATP-hydrolysing) subunit A